MKTLALLVFLGSAAVVGAQPPRSFTPSTPPRPDEATILNARVVAVDTAGGRITVRGVDVRADGGRDESFVVAAPVVARLGELRPGTEVLLTLRGTTVVDVKVSVASGGQSGTVIQGSGTSAIGGAARGGARAGGAGAAGGAVAAPGTATLTGTGA